MTSSDVDEKFIIYGNAERLNLFNGCKSFGEYLLNKLKMNEQKVLLVNGKTSIGLTSSEMLKQCIRYAVALRNYGIKRGDVIGICSENRFEYYFILCSTIFAGATVAPYGTSYTENELNHVINLSRPKIVFVSSQTINIATKIFEINSFIEKLIVFDQIDENLNIINANTFIGNANDEDFVCNSENIQENVCLILCSSGTTGLPKGVQLTQLNILITISQQFDRYKPIEDKLCPEPIVLSVAPWFHIFGCAVLIGMIANHNKVIFLPRFEEKLFLMSIEKYKVNTTFLVPTLMVILAKTPLVNNYNLSTLKIIYCGGATLQKEMEYAVINRFPGIVIRQGYAMTEGTLTMQTDFKHKAGSVGVVRNGICAKVICIETGKVLGPNQRGELLFKGDGIMKGYIGDVAATKQTIDKDNWLHTGDIGYYDNDGEFFIVDRLKELIKYKGFQVAPAEIEGILLSHEDIIEAAVVGLPDELAGELPLAFVVRKLDSNLTKQNAIDFVAAKVSYVKHLHGGVIFIDEIPKNPSGKILRRKLKEILTVEPKL